MVSIFTKLKKFDVYQKIDSDVIEHTKSGTLLSIVSMLCIIILTFYEVVKFNTPLYKESMLVDSSASIASDFMYANIDIELPRLPCSVISVDVADNTGQHLMNVHGSMEKIRLTSDGQIIGLEEDYNKSGGMTDRQSEKNLDHEHMKEQSENGEGCRLHGYLKLAKVPGNFHLSCHGMYSVIGRVYHNIFEYDTSHKINYIYFTDHIVDNDFAHKEDFKNNLRAKGEFIHEKEKFLQGYTSMLSINQLKNNYFTYTPNIPISAFYQINLIPTMIEKANDGKDHNVYQYNYKPYKAQNNGGCSAIFFNYEVNSISVKISPDEQNTLGYFLIRLFAILGGVLNLTWILDSLVYNFNVKILKKAEINRID